MSWTLQHERSNGGRALSPDVLSSQSRSPIRQLPNYSELDSINVESLLEEMRAARALNKTLTEKLSGVEAELENTRLSKDELQVEMEAKLAARGAALVDKIYSAQKERDAAVMARLKLANEERDEFLARLRKYESENGFDSGVDSNTILDDDLDLDTNYDELSVNDILKRVVGTNQGKLIEKHGTAIVDRVEQVHNLNKKKLMEQNEILQRDRDQAREEARRLDLIVKELKREKNSAEECFKTREKSVTKALQTQLEAVVKEKEEAEKRNQMLLDEQEKLRMYYSLHKSLSKEQSLRDQFNSTMDRFEGRLKQKETELKFAQREKEDCASQLDTLAREKNTLSAQLQEALALNEEQKGKIDQLERLVSVLRRRIAEGSEET